MASPAKKKRTCKVKHPLVAVHWLDACTEAGWIDNPKPDATLVVSYGLLIENTKEWVTLAQTHIPGEKGPGYWGNVWYIPKAMVKKIHTFLAHPDCKG
jgi:hypothetical protein